MSTHFDLHPYSVTVDDVHLNSWTGTIRTPDNVVSGEFPYGMIEELRITDSIGYDAFRLADGHIGFVISHLIEGYQP